MSDTLLTAIVVPAGVFTFVLAALAWARREQAAGATALSVLLISIGIWDIAYGLRTAGVPAPDDRLWMSLMYVGVASAPTALLVFAIEFCHHGTWLTTPVRLALLIEPIGTLFAAWTDGQLGLLFNGKTGIDIYLRENAGIAFWINVAYSYALMVIATAIFLRHRRSFQHTLYRQQATGVILGISFPWVGSLLMALNLTDRDLTPLTLTLSAFAFGFVILRSRMLAVVPIARDLLIDRMSDGVLVIDANGTVSDVNPAGRSMLGLGDDEVIGRHFADCLRHQPHVAAMLRTDGDSRHEVETRSGSVRNLDVHVSGLRDRRGRPVGTLALIRDITERKQLESELARLATVDPLTGIGNRRKLEEVAQRELNRRRRTGQPLSIAVIDVDNLKLINDAAGHESGDLALQAVATVLASASRASDLVVRMGGDEFALLLPDSDLARAAAAAERIRVLVRERAAADPVLQHLSVSIGVAEATGAQHTADDLLRAADGALYAAKAAGRNRVHSAA